MKTRNCPICGGGPAKKETRTTTFKYKGKVLTYKQHGLWCDECGDAVLNKNDLDATRTIIRNFQAKINGQLTTDEILRIRKKLGLTQEEAGEEIGGGPNAFRGYESGRSYPTQATENFLRLLDKYPKHIKEMRGKAVVKGKKL